MSAAVVSFHLPCGICPLIIASQAAAALALTPDALTNTPRLLATAGHWYRFEALEKKKPQPKALCHFSCLETREPNGKISPAEEKYIRLQEGEGEGEGAGAEGSAGRSQESRVGIKTHRDGSEKGSPASFEGSS